MTTDTPRTDTCLHFVHEPICKQFTEKELIDFCQEWAIEHLKPHHGKETYYARLGLLVDFATDLFNNK
jgi:hypothetical protein